MALFRFGDTVTIEQLCTFFYDNHVFDAASVTRTLGFVGSGDEGAVSYDTKSADEIVSLYMELFGCALWIYGEEASRTPSAENEGDFLVNQMCIELTCTRMYLAESGRLDLWNNRAFYNSAIDRGTWHTVPFPSAQDEKSRQWHRELLSQKLPQKLDDRECQDRLLNRCGATRERWGAGFISQELAKTLAERLGCMDNLTWNGMFRLQSVIFDMYEIARNYIEVVPSRPEYQRDMQEMTNRLKQLASESKRRRSGQ
jgi:hypothetical protein